MISRLRREWRNYGRDPFSFTLWAILTYRFGAWQLGLRRGPLRWLSYPVFFGMQKTVEVVSGIWVGMHAELGEDVHLVHSGNIKINGQAVIGARTSIMHDVTIGENMGRPGVPTVGEDCLIGAGCKVLGGITIGDGATLAPNSLVITDVPAGATAMGVPARVLPQKTAQRRAG